MGFDLTKSASAGPEVSSLARRRDRFGTGAREAHLNVDPA